MSSPLGNVLMHRKRKADEYKSQNQGLGLGLQGFNLQQE